MSWAYFPEGFAQLKIPCEIITRGFCLGFSDEFPKVCMITLIKRTLVNIFFKDLEEQFFVSDHIGSSGKQSDLVHFLKAQGKFFSSFPCTLFFTYF